MFFHNILDWSNIWNIHAQELKITVYSRGGCMNGLKMGMPCNRFKMLKMTLEKTFILTFGIIFEFQDAHPQKRTQFSHFQNGRNIVI